MDELTETVDTPRSAIEIAKRAIALHCLIAASHGVLKSDISEWLRGENLYDALSPWERTFLEAAENTRRDIVQATWRVEAQVALLWSTGKIDRMDALTGQCDTAPLVEAMPDLFGSTAQFIASSVLRSPEEIGAQYNHIYEAHERVRDARRRGAASQYDSGVVQERHYAMNWIIGYCGQAWDAINTDT